MYLSFYLNEIYNSMLKPINEPKKYRLQKYTCCEPVKTNISSISSGNVMQKYQTKTSLQENVGGLRGQNNTRLRLTSISLHMGI
jgi:hypothetical protein